MSREAQFKSDRTSVLIDADKMSIGFIKLLLKIELLLKEVVKSGIVPIKHIYL